jgi:hypothetical protein
MADQSKLLKVAAFQALARAMQKVGQERRDPQLLVAATGLQGAVGKLLKTPHAKLGTMPPPKA